MGGGELRDRQQFSLLNHARHTALYDWRVGYARRRPSHARPLSARRWEADAHFSISMNCPFPTERTEFDPPPAKRRGLLPRTLPRAATPRSGTPTWRSSCATCPTAPCTVRRVPQQPPAARGREAALAAQLGRQDRRPRNVRHTSCSRANPACLPTPLQVQVLSGVRERRVRPLGHQEDAPGECRSRLTRSADRS